MATRCHKNISIATAPTPHSTLCFEPLSSWTGRALQLMECHPGWEKRGWKCLPAWEAVQHLGVPMGARPVAAELGVAQGQELLPLCWGLTVPVVVLVPSPAADSPGDQPTCV